MSSERPSNSGEAPSADLAELVEQLCHGDIAASDAARLEQMVVDDPQVRRFYVRYLQMHATMPWLAGAMRATDLPVKTSQEPSISVQPKAIAPPRRWLSPSFLALAASLLLVGYFVTMVGLLAWDRFQRSHIRQLATTPAAIEPFVTLTEATGCRWAEAPPSPGEPFGHRLLKLQAGVAELKFAKGAQVTVEGPCEFEVRSPNEGFLRHGMLMAHVPQQAIGFTVQTPTVTVVDLGTEFAMNADEQGITEVEVLTGKVKLQPRASTNDSSPTQPITVIAGSALRVEPPQADGAPQVRKIPATGNRLSKTANASKSRHIVVSGALASSTFSADLSVNNLINGSGLVGERHSAIPNDMWYAAPGKNKGEYVLFDLARPYRLESMKVWNYNDSYLDRYRWRGVKQADIYVSKTSKGLPGEESSDWQLIAEDVQFDPGTGTPDYSTPMVISLKGAEARFVAIVIDEALGHDPGGPSEEPDGAGLSEVQFFGERQSTPGNKSAK
jgi:hypothetical protein